MSCFWFLMGSQSWLSQSPEKPLYYYLLTPPLYFLSNSPQKYYLRFDLKIPSWNSLNSMCCGMPRKSCWLWLRLRLCLWLWLCLPLYESLRLELSS